MNINTNKLRSWVGVKCVYQVHTFLVLKMKYKIIQRIIWLYGTLGGLSCSYLKSKTELGAVHVAKSEPESAWLVKWARPICLG